MKILFVCTGNICRSPTAEGVLFARLAEEGLANKVSVDSAGTHNYHIGEPPDPRSQAAAKRRGIDISALRARKVEPGDFSRFDLILAMDRGHHAHLSRLCPPEKLSRLALFLDFAPDLGIKDTPDPYYGPSGEFERTLDIIEAGVEGVLAYIREVMGLPGGAR
jgi:protein-tyrosine phosphatase